MFHDGGVGIIAVGFLLGLERCLEDRISVAVVGIHNVLIAAARANRESASVVYVYLANGIYVYVQSIGR